MSSDLVSVAEYQRLYAGDGDVPEGCAVSGAEELLSQKVCRLAAINNGHAKSVFTHVPGEDDLALGVFGRVSVDLLDRGVLCLYSSRQRERELYRGDIDQQLLRLLAYGHADIIDVFGPQFYSDLSREVCHKYIELLRASGFSTKHMRTLNSCRKMRLCRAIIDCNEHLRNFLLNQ